MEEKKPQFGRSGPIWWHHHGDKMGLIPQKNYQTSLVINNHAARLIIERRQTDWRVLWQINHGENGSASGYAIFSKDDILQAFGLSSEIGIYGQWLIDRYGGTTAAQFKYIRYLDWLNIPCPGTGNDGDPNISLCIDSKIKNTIKQLTR